MQNLLQVVWLLQSQQYKSREPTRPRVLRLDNRQRRLLDHSQHGKTSCPLEQGGAVQREVRLLHHQRWRCSLY